MVIKDVRSQPSTTSRWCSNSYQPDLKTLFKIADILGVDVKDLIQSKEDIQ